MRVLVAVLLSFVMVSCAARHAAETSTPRKQVAHPAKARIVPLQRVAPTNQTRGTTTTQLQIQVVEAKDGGQTQYRLVRRVTNQIAVTRQNGQVVHRAGTSISVGPLPPELKALQPVFFATNREIKNGPKLQLEMITAKRSLSIKYGLAMVSVPQKHLIGHVERPKSWFLDYLKGEEKDAEHFRLKQLETLTREELIEKLKGESDAVLLFVHGYNVPFEDGIFKAAQIAYDASFAGSVVAFSWPAAGNLFKYDYESVHSALFSGGQLFLF